MQRGHDAYHRWSGRLRGGERVCRRGPLRRAHDLRHVGLVVDQAFIPGSLEPGDQRKQVGGAGYDYNRVGRLALVGRHHIFHVRREVRYHRRCARNRILVVDDIEASSRQLGGDALVPGNVGAQVITDERHGLALGPPRGREVLAQGWCHDHGLIGKRRAGTETSVEPEYVHARLLVGRRTERR